MRRKERTSIPPSLRKFNIVEDVDVFKSHLQKAGVSGLALDIDETLSNTVLHWVLELQAQFGNPENLTAEQIIATYQYTQNVPYWKTPEALDWMHQTRESDKLHENLPLIEGAEVAVQQLDMIKPIVAYPTNRPINVTSGTKKWLKKHKFPKAPIIARPKGIPHAEGNKWKAGVLELLYPEIVGIVDDNQGLIDYLSPNYKGVIFLFGAEKVPKTNLNVIACKTWEEVVKEAQKQFYIYNIKAK